MAVHTRLGRSALGLGIYSLCIVFVCSFLLFEVLDIDGSDFPSEVTQAVAAEPPHSEARRLHLDIARDLIVLPVLPVMSEPMSIIAPLPVVPVTPPRPLLPGRHHRLLARASLDTPPSA
jgi:hypothetical protein